MDVVLRILNESAPAKSLNLKGDTLIGRGSECQLRITSSQVSRRHCQIRVVGETVVVRDLRSSNGTQIDGKFIRPEVDIDISPGSTLEVGPFRCVVEFSLPRNQFLGTAALSRASTADETAFDSQLAVTRKGEVNLEPNSTDYLPPNAQESSIELPAAEEQSDDSAMELPEAPRGAPPRANGVNSAKRKSLYDLQKPAPSTPTQSNEPKEPADEIDDPAMRDFFSQFEP